MFTGIKNITDFIYRTSIPSNPNPGSFYWIEEKGKTKFYFADSSKKLLRLDSEVLDILWKDENFIFENKNGIVSVKFNYGSFEEPSNGIAKVEDVIAYINKFHEDFINEEDGIVTFTKGGNTYFAQIKPYKNDAIPEITSSKTPTVILGEIAYFTIKCSDINCDVYYTVKDKTTGNIITEETRLDDFTKLPIEVNYILPPEKYLKYEILLRSKSRENNLWSETKTEIINIQAQLPKPIVSVENILPNKVKFTIENYDECIKLGDIFFSYYEKGIENEDGSAKYIRINGGDFTITKDLVENAGKITKQYWVKIDTDVVDIWKNNVQVVAEYYLPTLTTPTISVYNYSNEYDTSVLKFKIDNYDSTVTYKYGYSSNNLTQTTTGDGGNIITIPASQTQPVTIYIKATKSGYNDSTVASKGSYYFNTPKMYWNVISNDTVIENLTETNIKSYNSINGKSFPVEITATKSKLDVSDGYGKMIFAYNKNLGKLTSITDKPGNNMTEQFDQITIGNFYVYVLKVAAVYSDLVTIFKK